MPLSVADLLSSLIQIPSVNPAHTSDPEIAGEAAMAQAFGSLLSERGLEVTLHPLMGDDRPAVIAESPAAPHRLLFGVHLDTVGVDHMTVPPFAALRENGRIVGRGACDMKGPTAALLHALTPERVKALTDRGVQVVVIGTPDEECGMGGAKRLAQTALKADYAVILEPTCNQPVIAHKAAHWIDITLKGRSGHGSQPESGISTHAALAKLLPTLYQLHAEQNDAYTDPLLGQSTLNIGRIEGGTTYNLIPDKTVLRLDRRLVPNEPRDGFDRAVQDELNRLVAEGQLTEGIVSVAADIPAFSTPADSDLVQHLSASINRILHKPATPTGTSWVSDAAPLSACCQQILVFGPGDIAQAHTADEYIEEASLNEGADILADFLDHYPAGSSC